MNPGLSPASPTKQLDPAAGLFAAAAHLRHPPQQPSDPAGKAFFSNLFQVSPWGYQSNLI